MNKLSFDMVKNISLFLEDNDTRHLLLSNKDMYEFRYTLIYLDYKYALNSDNKNKIKNSGNF